MMREQLVRKGIDKFDQEMEGMVKGLRKQMTIGMRSDFLKFDSLQQVTEALKRNHR